MLKRLPYSSRNIPLTTEIILSPPRGAASSTSCPLGTEPPIPAARLVIIELASNIADNLETLAAQSKLAGPNSPLGQAAAKLNSILGVGPKLAVAETPLSGQDLTELIKAMPLSKEIKTLFKVAEVAKIALSFAEDPVQAGLKYTGIQSGVPPQLETNIWDFL